MSRLTVAIPIFNGKKWVDNIIKNVDRLPDFAVAILSGEKNTDGAIELLGEHYRNSEKVQVINYLGKPGWRAHCNFLIRKNETEMFAILPQDDVALEDYYTRLMQVLDSHSKFGIAIGTVVIDGLYPELKEFSPPPIPLGVSEPLREAVELEKKWNLGIPFRGVIRSEFLIEIDENDSDDFMDQLWIFSILLKTHLISVRDAIYIKRYHKHNTHTKWKKPDINMWQKKLSQLISNNLN